MVSARFSSNGRTINPYLRPVEDAAPTPSVEYNILASRPVVNHFKKTMGIQSQKRGGSVKACKKRGTSKVRALCAYRQNPLPGGTIFIGWQHCRVCKAERLRKQGRLVNIPHRAHHVRCVRNLKTRGLSARMVTIDKEPRAYLKANKAGLNTALGRRLDAVTPSVHRFFKLRTHN